MKKTTLKRMLAAAISEHHAHQTADRFLPDLSLTRAANLATSLRRTRHWLDSSRVPGPVVVLSEESLRRTVRSYFSKSRGRLDPQYLSVFGRQ
jgi:hypothetical protein